MNSLRIPFRHIAIIALFAAVAVLPMVFRGMPGGNDVAQNYEFANTVVSSFRSGDLWVSFDGNANHGMGEVRLRVYPPLAYYALAGWFLLLGDWYVASLVVFFTIFLMGGIGMYLWGSEVSTTSVGLAVAAIYTFAPFHLNEIYNNFLYAQFAAGAVLPFCFLFLHRVIKYGRIVDSLLLAVSFALLVTTHLPMTVIGSLSMAVFSLAAIRRSNLKNILWSILAAAAGLILSAFYWIRLLTEMKWAKHAQPQYFSEIWSYKVNFLISSRTFTDFMNDDLSLWFGDLLLTATLLLCVPAIIALFRFEREKQPFVPVLAMLAFAVFMVTPLSTFVWDTFEPLQKMQFPWRWMTVITLSASLISGIGLVRLSNVLRTTNNRTITVATAAAVLPFVLFSAFVIRAGAFTGRGEFNAQMETLGQKQTYDGWWPVWVKSDAFARRKNVAAADRTVEIKKWLPASRSFTVGPGTEQDAEIKTFFYPHWKASVNGVETAIQRTTDGVISLPIPVGLAEVQLTFVEPACLVAAKWVSVAAWMLVLPTLFGCIWIKRKSYGTYS